MSIDWTRRAVSDLRKLDPAIRRQIRAAVTMYVVHGQGDVRRLRGYDREWRLRVRSWRVRFSYEDATKPPTLVVLRVLHRREAYR